MTLDCRVQKILSYFVLYMNVTDNRQLPSGLRGGNITILSTQEDLFPEALRQKQLCPSTATIKLGKQVKHKEKKTCHNFANDGWTCDLHGV